MATFSDALKLNIGPDALQVESFTIATEPIVGEASRTGTRKRVVADGYIEAADQDALRAALDAAGAALNASGGRFHHLRHR